jgi:hypothetical protein
VANDWASDNLQVIRTLMERSALYRRALAPLMAASGAVGAATGAIGWWKGMDSPREFVLLWLAACAVTQVLCFLLARRQAWRDQEPFFTPPARRVCAALAPGFCAGGLAAIAFLVPGQAARPPALLLALFWFVCHACALHAAGAFMRRGIRLFAWVVLAAATVAGVFYCAWPESAGPAAANLAMGAVFGGLHLVFGAYLYLTERPDSVADVSLPATVEK